VWGYNEHGQLGVGDTEDRNKPTLINHNIPSSDYSSSKMYLNQCYCFPVVHVMFNDVIVIRN